MFSRELFWATVSLERETLSSLSREMFELASAQYWCVDKNSKAVNRENLANRKMCSASSDPDLVRNALSLSLPTVFVNLNETLVFFDLDEAV